MEGTSLTPQQEKLKALQALLPEAFAEGKIDWEKLKATLGEVTLKFALNHNCVKSRLTDG